MAERIVNAAGWNIALQPRVSFTEHPAPPAFRFPFTVPDRLWRLQAPACFRTIKFFDQEPYPPRELRAEAKRLNEKANRLFDLDGETSSF